ncbi:MAG: hypothetical protein Q7L19_17860 [Pseudohongiella sp.]|nr:hypothetical protein [Pseudohongiella sp.]
MIPGLALYACGLMLSRLVYLPNDGPLPVTKNAALLTAQLLVLFLVYPFHLAVWLSAAVLIMVALLAHHFETAGRIRRGSRILTLAAQLLIPAGLFWSLGADARAWTLNVPETIVAASLGILVLANEVNYLIRLLFVWCNLEPKMSASAGDSSPPPVDEEEYKAGRVIGMLERALIFLIIFFVNDFAAVGFILAAKGLIRIQQTKDRQFSEYMLIGTLASTIFSVVVALVLQE